MTSSSCWAPQVSNPQNNNTILSKEVPSREVSSREIASQKVPSKEVQSLIQERVRYLAAKAYQQDIQHQNTKAQQLKYQAQFNEHHIKYSKPIAAQTTGGIGGKNHQHGIPGGRYSARGPTSAHGQHRKRSKNKK